MPGCNGKVAGNQLLKQHEHPKHSYLQKVLYNFGYRMMIRAAGGVIMSAVERYFAGGSVIARTLIMQG